MSQQNLDKLSPDERRIYEKALNFARKNKKLIAARLTNPDQFPPEDHPVSVFMAGSPGAGKTEASKELLEGFGEASRILRIDPDELRDEFEDYRGGNAWLFHSAVSILVDRIFDLALKRGQSLILDGTLSNYEKAENNIRRSLKKNRKVEILYVYQRPELAWKFVQAREVVEGRRISPEDFVNQYFAARKAVNSLKREFGAEIRVDLLMKNIDGSHRWYKAGVDQVDNHVPEQYDEESLFGIISAA